jgi:RHS repeat-associated protein
VYKYDTLNRLTSVTAGSDTYTYGYSGASPLVQTLTRMHGGVTTSITTYGYDSVNRLLTMTTQTPGGATISQYGYTYNAPQDLRDGETSTDAVPSYAPGEVDYTHNNVNELVKLSDPGVKSLAYDADGNLVQGYTPGGQQFTANYDSHNHLTGLSYGSNLVDYSYLGNILIKKTVNGVETDYVYDGLCLIQERNTNPNNNLVNEYTYGLGLPGGIGGLLRLNYQVNQGGGSAYSYLHDGKGNVTALLDAAGTVQASYQYDPFGKPMGSSGSINQPMRFSTKPYDDQTGLSYYGYRFYNPALGRWLTRDPIGEDGGINLYEFTKNDPVNRMDPDGLQADVIRGVSGAGPAGPLVGATIWGGYMLWENVLKPWYEARKKQSDPIPYPGIFNPGRDANGHCIPCPGSSPYWHDPKDAHGSCGGGHYHRWVYDQDPDCNCYPRRESSPVPSPDSRPFQR